MFAKIRERSGSSDRPQDRAVSPVIGIVLMIAVTAIMAIGVGAFVTDLGSSAKTEVPQAQFEFSYDSGGNVIVAHEGGDQLDGTKVSIIGASGGSFTFSGATVTTGDTAGGTYTSGDVIRVVYDVGNGKSFTLAKDIAP